MLRWLHLLNRLYIFLTLTEVLLVVAKDTFQAALNAGHIALNRFQIHWCPLLCLATRVANLSSGSTYLKTCVLMCEQSLMCTDVCMITHVY